MVSRQFVNAVSASRIALGLLFVLCFQSNAILLLVSLLVCVTALATDVLDGYLARRYRLTAQNGRLWDSLGDKAFYAAVVVAFNAHGFIWSVLTWALLTREVTLYITRILFIENLPDVEKIRPYTNWHGYFMYATIALGLLRMYSELQGGSLPLHGVMQATAGLAVTAGFASIWKYVRLREAAS